MNLRCLILRLLFVLCAGVWMVRGEGNRLVYLEEQNPFYPDGRLAKLTTPQWIGEAGVEAVVVLAIDDMRAPEKYEAYLRPILERLKAIDGRAPVSIMSNAIDPTNAQYRAWLKEGLSLEVHTLSHPCALLAKGNFEAAANTYHGCVELLNLVEGNKPTAFRMPCCDSMNSPSPRFYAEIFNQVSPNGSFLTIDSSVMNLIGSNDPELPKGITLDEQGRERFKKYVPFPSFTTTIENYPYPYVIGKLCWEFPGAVPSDWEAQNLNKPNASETVEDWKKALDAIVLKRGTFNMIFHPHGWIQSTQVVQWIDYAVQTHGKKVKFLTFREAQDRLDKHLLGGTPLRGVKGRDQGVRILDLNGDGFMDAVIANPEKRLTRVWVPSKSEWKEFSFPAPLVRWVGESAQDTGARFGFLRPGGAVSCLSLLEEGRTGWHFTENGWEEDSALVTGLEVAGKPVLSMVGGRDRGCRFRDFDGDGLTELLVSNPEQQSIFKWRAEESRWRPMPYALPTGVSLVNAEGQDNGLRFVDLNVDGYEDLVFSNPERYAVYLFTSDPKPHLDWDLGWTQKVREGTAGDPSSIPPIVRSGERRNNGVWFKGGRMWVQNENTDHLPDKVDRRSYEDLMSFPSPPALTPEESLAALQVRPGFQIELAAQEPATQDPVAIEWGADGKLWVVEMGDYNEQGSGGIVRFLEDQDGNGRYEKSTVFLDKLQCPNGVMPWRSGVLISAAPEILYAEDADGDGKAEIRRTLFSGFVQGNQQHRVNGFVLGLDNWIYGANGDSGGTIVSALTGQKANLRGRDFRFQPDSGVFETAPGQTQFGRHRDDWGNWFGNNNPAWLWHFHIPEHYFSRNPLVAVRSARNYLAQYEGGTRAFPVSKPMQRFNWPDLVDTVTAACSPIPYRDALFGPEYEASIFICDPAHNVVHREVLTPAGISFTSKRGAGEEDREFLASKDNWFRPVMAKTGPDGALYVVDMHRLVIEHIEYGLPGMEKQIDLQAGRDRGRIYRVYPTGVALRPIPKLASLKGKELADALRSENGWQRDTAHRLILERKDASALERLEQLAKTDPSAKVRLQALAVIDGLEKVTASLVESALQDAHPAVREHAIRLTEKFSQKGSEEEKRRLLDRLNAMATDAEERVRYQLAFTLGEFRETKAGEVLAALARTDDLSDGMVLAIESSAPSHLDVLLEQLFRTEVWPAPELARHLVALAVHLKKEKALAVALTETARRTNDLWVFSVASGLADAVDRTGLNFSSFAKKSGPDLKRGLEGLQPVFDRARQTALNAGRNEEDRLAAIRLLGRSSGGVQADLPTLSELLRPQQSTAVQRAALQALSRSRGPEVPKALIQCWRQASPSFRGELAEVLLSRGEWAAEFVRALEAEEIPLAQVTAEARQHLLERSSDELRGRAQKLFGSREKKKISDRLEEMGKLKANPNRGAELFKQHCANCHRYREEGIVLGPDLAGLSNRSAGNLLLAVVDPNDAVESTFLSYTAVLKDGQEFSGIISSETASSLTLKMAGGNEQTILRNDLEEISSSGLSLMPEGFETILSAQDMADLIHYLR